MERVRDLSLIGFGALIGVAAIACTDGPRQTVGNMVIDLGHIVADADGVPDAFAQTPTACEQWEVKSVLPEKIQWQSYDTTDQDGSANSFTFPVIEAFTLERGWEPLGGENLGAVLVRRCVQ